MASKSYDPEEGYKVSCVLGERYGCNVIKDLIEEDGDFAAKVFGNSDDPEEQLIALSKLATHCLRYFLNDDEDFRRQNEEHLIGNSGVTPGPDFFTNRQNPKVVIRLDEENDSPPQIESTVQEKFELSILLSPRFSRDIPHPYRGLAILGFITHEIGHLIDTRNSYFKYLAEPDAKTIIRDVHVDEVNASTLSYALRSALVCLSGHLPLTGVASG